ncbi:uncharacterized protein LOC128786109 isoform X4 [Vidua chalybeata]|uniref:uncharacterized protein LOC128786109 isoform X4 n=1 Tax=Vidua chalybeata TaxID=81927 RepID=UPI0023A8CCCD|nr:uncharacterized protein LOC128786109 isoform X4 [Vidua chalybeata]
MPRRRPESRRCPAAGGSAVGLAGVAPHSLLPPCVCVCKRLPLLLAAAASRPTFSPPRSLSGELVSASLAGLQSGFDSPYSSSWLLTCLSTVEKPFSLRWEDLKFKSNVDLKICENEGWIITCYKLISQHLV